MLKIINQYQLKLLKMIIKICTFYWEQKIKLYNTITNDNEYIIKAKLQEKDEQI